MSSFAEPITSAQVLHICDAAIANKEFLYHQKKTEADSLFMEVQNLRSENSQLRAIAINSDREKDEEARKASLLQQVIDAQRRVIHDFEQMRLRRPANPPGFVHTNGQTFHGGFPLFTQQGCEAGRVAQEGQAGQADGIQGRVTPGESEEITFCEESAD